MNDNEAVLLALVKSGRPEATGVVKQYLDSHVPTHATVNLLAPHLNTDLMLVLLKSLARSTSIRWSASGVHKDLRYLFVSLRNPIDLQQLAANLKDTDERLVLLTIALIGTLHHKGMISQSECSQIIVEHRALAEHPFVELALGMTLLFLESAQDAHGLRNLSTLLQTNCLDVRFYIAAELGKLYDTLPKRIRLSKEMFNTIRTTQSLDEKTALTAAASLLQCSWFENEIAILLRLIQSPFHSVPGLVIQKLMMTQNTKLVQEVREFKKNNKDPELQRAIDGFLKRYDKIDRYLRTLDRRKAFRSAARTVLAPIQKMIRVSLPLLMLGIGILYVIPLWAIFHSPGPTTQLTTLSILLSLVLPLVIGYLMVSISLWEQNDSPVPWVVFILFIAGGVGLFLMARTMGLIAL